MATASIAPESVGHQAMKDWQTVRIVLQQGGYCKQGNFVCTSCITLPALAPADDQPRALLSQMPEVELAAFAAEHAAVVAAQGGWKCTGVYSNYDAGMEAMKELSKRWSDKLSDRQLHFRYGETYGRKGFKYHMLELEHPAVSG